MLLILLLTLSACFGIAVVWGAPYLPILRRDSQKILALADLKPGQTIIDLGSGDGRLLRAAAKSGARGIGYEINPLMVLISRIVCWRYRRLVTIHLANMWQIQLPPSDVIYVFLLDKWMAKLDAKISREITKPTLLISYIFEIPARQPIKHTPNTFIYEYLPGAPTKTS